MPGTTDGDAANVSPIETHPDQDSPLKVQPAPGLKGRAGALKCEFALRREQSMPARRTGPAEDVGRAAAGHLLLGRPNHVASVVQSDAGAHERAGAARGSLPGNVAQRPLLTPPKVTGSSCAPIQDVEASSVLRAAEGAASDSERGRAGPLARKSGAAAGANARGRSQERGPARHKAQGPSVPPLPAAKGNRHMRSLSSIVAVQGERGAGDSASGNKASPVPLLLAEGLSYESLVSRKLRDECGLHGGDWVSLDIQSGGREAVRTPMSPPGPGRELYSPLSPMLDKLDDDEKSRWIEALIAEAGGAAEGATEGGLSERLRAAYAAAARASPGSRGVASAGSVDACRANSGQQSCRGCSGNGGGGMGSAGSLGGGEAAGRQMAA
ncbi:unnamed protein product [Pedinophyceae sp. YPF-701]|nr:unnamed protein product [Pedinophyceae sp. YPF-701]